MATADWRSLEIPDLLVRECCRCSLSLEHDQKQSPFVLTRLRHCPASIFAFPPSFSPDDWAPPPAVNATAPVTDLSLFPFLRSIGTNLPAILHAPSLRRFLHLLSTSLLKSQVLQAVADKKQIIFTGHSSGGAIAILATVWLLHQSCSSLSTANVSTLCITFGSPLVGDAVFGHALRREGWAQRFLHFVSPRDIVPRALLSPLDSDFLSFLRLLSPTSSDPTIDSGYSRTQLALRLYTTATRNTAYLAGRAAIVAAGSTSLLAEALNGFVKLGPYRPAGTYAFCTDAGDFVVSRNSNAVLQLLFYSLQAGDGEDMSQLAVRSFDEHFEYELRVARGLSVRKVAWLDSVDAIPLSFGDGAAGDEVARMAHFALRALGLSTEGRLCLQAAWESEKQRAKNQMKADGNRDKMEKALNFLGDYRKDCELRGVGYYDSFKLQKNTEDFNANLKRLELAGLFDEITEMLKQMELPDGFEGRPEWVALGTEYRRLVEPLDIANYYRHAKNEDTGPYMIKGRPNRYRFTQRWLERADRVAAGTFSESCFWARVEELSLDHRVLFEEVKEAVMELERDTAAWMNAGLVGNDVLLECSTFVRWWKTLPGDYRLTASPLRNLFT